MSSGTAACAVASSLMPFSDERRSSTADLASAPISTSPTLTPRSLSSMSPGDGASTADLGPSACRPDIKCQANAPSPITARAPNSQGHMEELIWVVSDMRVW